MNKKTKNRNHSLRKLEDQYIQDTANAISKLEGTKSCGAYARKLAHLVLQELPRSSLYNLNARPEYLAEAVFAVVEAHIQYEYQPKLAARQAKDLQQRQERLDKLDAAYGLLESAQLRPKDRDILHRLIEVRARERAWNSDQRKHIKNAQNAVLKAWAPRSWKAFEVYRWDILADILLTGPLTRSLSDLGRNRDKLRNSLKSRAKQLDLNAKP